MVTHRGLSSSGRLDEVAGAHLTRRCVRDQAEQPQADRISQHLEPGGELFSIAAVERFSEYRFAARLDRRNLHDPPLPQILILTFFNITDTVT
jgi:hypothetical protein